MKKISLFILLLLVAGNLIAQSNTWFVYGTAGYSNNSSNNNLPSNSTNNSINWSVNPGIGYQFTDNLAVGIQGSYNNTTNNNTNYYYYPLYNNSSLGYYLYGSTPKSMYNWSLGAFARYNHNLSNIFFFYGQLNMSYLAGSQTYSNANYNTVTNLYEDAKATSNGMQVALIPGFGAHIYKGISLIFDFGGINYTTLSQDLNSTHYTESHITVTFAQQFNLGITDNFKIHHKSHTHHEPGADLRRHIKESEDDDDDTPPAKK